MGRNNLAILKCKNRMSSGSYKDDVRIFSGENFSKKGVDSAVSRVDSGENVSTYNLVLSAVEGPLHI